MAAVDHDCPRCGAPAGTPCWRSYQAAAGSVLVGVPPADRHHQLGQGVPGYCTARSQPPPQP